MSAEVFEGHEPHRGFSTTTLLVAILAGALVAGLLLYPWQRGIIDERERTIAAMAAAHETMKAEVEALLDQVAQAQDKAAAFRGEAERLRGRLDDTRARLGEERTAHRRAEARANTMGGAALEDGRHMAYVRGVQLGNPSFATLDLLSVWHGEAAVRQAAKDGMTPDAEGLYVTNQSRALRTMEVAANASTELNYWHRDVIKTGKPVSLEVFANVMNGTKWWHGANQDTRYWLTVRGGRITSIHPYFTVIAC